MELRKHFWGLDAESGRRASGIATGKWCSVLTLFIMYGTFSAQATIVEK